MNESDFYSKLRKNLPMVHWCRIENSIGSGMFDVNGCWESKEVWVELKEVYPKYGVLMRSSQYAWSFQRARAGGNIWVLGFEKRSSKVFFYHPPFNVTPHQRWLKVLDKPVLVVVDNWQMILEVLFSVQHP